MTWKRYVTSVIKKGHVKVDCYALQKRNKQMSVKPAAFAASAMRVSDMPDVHKEVPAVAYLSFVSSECFPVRIQ